MKKYVKIKYIYKLSFSSDSTTNSLSENYKQEWLFNHLVYPYATVVAEKMYISSKKFKTPVIINITGTLNGGMKFFDKFNIGIHYHITNALKIKPKIKTLFSSEKWVHRVDTDLVGNDGISFAHAVVLMYHLDEKHSEICCSR